ncbi:hypothetical protein [Paenibacillus validus]|uniref:Y-family DNA polymerase n=1 Tax=Paenibacillus validus TaxID=44253 RepID=UPI003D2C9C31
MPEFDFDPTRFRFIPPVLRRFMKIAYDYSPLVETMSIDECYVDITGSKSFGTPLHIAQTIQSRIREELGLPCSIRRRPE